MSKVQAVARVQVTVEFALGGGAWPAETPIGDINKRAREIAEDILRAGLVINGRTMTTGAGGKTPATIVGEPAVTAILVQEQT